MFFPYPDACYRMLNKNSADTVKFILARFEVHNGAETNARAGHCYRECALVEREQKSGRVTEVQHRVGVVSTLLPSPKKHGAA